MPASVESAMIQGSYIYFIPRDGNFLYRLDRKSLESSKRVAIAKDGLSKTEEREIFPYPGGHIGYIYGGKLSVVDSETLEECS